MEIDNYLTTTALIDCTGQISHRLTLQFDGMVRIDYTAGRSVTVDPATRTVLTPGAHIESTLMDQAVMLRP